jgi:hypothetical protein
MPPLTRRRNLPKIRQPREPEQSIINEKTIADFTAWPSSRWGFSSRPCGIHTGKGVQRTIEGSPARWRLHTN